MAFKSEEDLETALSLIQTGNEKFPDNEWANFPPTLEIVKRFGSASLRANTHPCLAVPTWLYGSCLFYLFVYFFVFFLGLIL
jgi:hypothetical protein